jgi:hypothetical protein
MVEAMISLQEKIKYIQSQVTLTKNPKSVILLTDVLLKLKEAELLWLQPGKQRAAMTLEEEANELLRNQ